MKDYRDNMGMTFQHIIAEKLNTLSESVIDGNYGLGDEVDVDEINNAIQEIIEDIKNYKEDSEGSNGGE